jgi:hypothetical protein
MSRSDDGGRSSIGEPPDGKHTTAETELAQRVMFLARAVKQNFPRSTTMSASSYSNGKAGRYAPSKCPRTGTEADAGLKNTRDLPARNISVAIQRGSLII